MKITDLFELGADYIDNPVDTRHIQIDPDTKVGLIVNGDIVKSDKFKRIVDYLKTTTDKGTFIIVKDGIELLRVNF